MKKELIIALFLLIAVPAFATAAPAKPGPYFAAFIGGSALQDADLDTSGYDWGKNNSYNYKDNVEFDTGVVVGGTGGYDFGFIRLEGELSYKYNEVDSVKDRYTGYPYYDYLDSEVGTFAFMANLFFDLHNDTPVTPYFGGGIGFATMYLNNYSYDYYNDYYYDEEDDDDTVLAYQVGGGLEIAINRRLSLDVGYRYFATDTAEFDVNTYDVSQTSKIKFESHNVTVGVRFRF